MIWWKRRYQTTDVTFVHGQLNTSYFGLSLKRLPAQLLTPEASASPFTSFSVGMPQSEGQGFPDPLMVSSQM